MVNLAISSRRESVDPLKRTVGASARYEQLAKRLLYRMDLSFSLQLNLIDIAVQGCRGVLGEIEPTGELGEPIDFRLWSGGIKVDIVSLPRGYRC